ncbi:MAG: DUF1801 domain-containing protein [Cellulomonadaceae bacterium]|nr:DUF1801 domain-containing protein [Cellulomonadaceae bacterium]
MGEGNKTVETDADVAAFVAGVPDARRRADAEVLLDLMGRVTGLPPRMWGTSIVGFGRYHYVYATGREGDIPVASFSPRKGATTVYLPDYADAHVDLLAHLGPHTRGKGCLYIKHLDDIDLTVLEQILRRSCARFSSDDPFAAPRS